MKINPPHFGLLLLLLLTSAVWGQVYVPVAGEYGVDDERKLILLRGSASDLRGVTELKLNDQRFIMHEPVDAKSPKHSYNVARGEIIYALQFTELPLFTLTTNEAIGDEPKVGVQVTYSDNDQTFRASGGVEYRGGFSLELSKKSLDLEFNDDVQFGELRNDDDWILDALYNEPLRVNAFVGHKLWLEQHRLAYANQEPRAQPGPGVELVEVFLNNTYAGLYLLSEQIDRKQLRLKKTRDGVIRGELYKGEDDQLGTDFGDNPPLPDYASENWSGYELKHPKADEIIDWGNLYAFHQFVTETSDAEFTAGIAERFDLDNAADFLLFINLLGMADNASRNLFTARYDRDSPYFHLPWDLDGSFGNSPRGDRIAATDFWYGNALYRRLTQLNAGGFNDLLCARYGELRNSGVYSVKNIAGKLTTAVDLLIRSGTAGREKMAWPKTASVNVETLAYTEDWLVKRLDFMDNFVCALAAKIDGSSTNSTLQVFPNPSNGIIAIEQQAGDISPVFQVYDLKGQRLYSGLAGLRSTIDLSHLPPGTYYVKMGENATTVFIR